MFCNCSGLGFSVRIIYGTVIYFLGPLRIVVASPTALVCLPITSFMSNFLRNFSFVSSLFILGPISASYHTAPSVSGLRIADCGLL